MTGSIAHRNRLSGWIILIAALLVIFGTVSAQAAIVESGSCGDNVRYEIRDDGTARLFTSGSGYGVTSSYEFGTGSNESPFYSHDDITTIVVEAGVTQLGAYIFTGCNSVTSVTLPEGLDTIGEYSFSGTHMNAITLPDSLRVIDGWAFLGCGELESVHIPANVYAIGREAFSQCDSVTAFTTDSGNHYFSAEDGVLFNKEKTTLKRYPAGRAGTYTIPDTVTAVDYGAFDWAKGLTSVTIPDNGISFAPLAFTYCTALTSVNLPGSMQVLEFGLFYNCTSLQQVTIGSGIEVISARAFDNCESLTFVELPDTVTTIGYAAFRDCWRLEGILIPSSVTDFGTEIFDGTIGLKIYGTAGSAAQTYAEENDIQFMAVNGQCGVNVHWALSDGVLDIFGTGPMYNYTAGRLNLSPFRGNTSIRKVNIREGVTSVGDYTFSGCSGIEGSFQPDLPSSLLRIGKSAFSSCTSLTEFIIPEKVQEIGDYAFGGCSALEAVSYRGRKETAMTIGTNIYDAASTLVIYGRLGTAAIADAQNRGIKFYLIDSFEFCDFEVPDNVTEIGEEAFAGIAAEHIWLEEKVTSIGSRAFAGCSHLTKIYIPNSCTSIASDAFAGCREDLMIYGHENAASDAFAAANGYYFALAPVG